ncbi:MAG: carboxylate--amine ligase [Actinomycetota bacterium]
MSRRPDLHETPAVLVGLDSMQGLQAARILHGRGVPVYAFAKDPTNDACRTNVCREIRFADTRSDDLIPALEALGRKLGKRAVLFPCEDQNVLVVSRFRDRLAEWYHIALPPHDVVEMLMDKTRFYRHAQEAGLPIPPTHFLRSRDELDAVAAALRFPVILKPANSATRLWEKNCMVSAFKVSDLEELYDLYDRFHTFSEALIVQEWIAGPDSNLYSCNCYFDRTGRPVVTFVARKLRQWPPHVGKSSFGVEVRSDEVREETIRLFESVGYRGLGYVEFKLDERHGRQFIVEPNVGRPTGRSAIAEAGGVELLYTMYCDLLGLPLPADREQAYGGAKWVHLRRDLQSAIYYWRRGDLTLGEWLRSWRGKKAFALFSWSDPMPFLSDLRRVAWTVVSPGQRRKRRRKMTGAPPRTAPSRTT